MDVRDSTSETPLDGNPSSGGVPNDLPNKKPGEVENILALGEHVVGFVGDVAELARMEALLAIKSIPQLLMLWFLMVPVILLTWCSFSGWIAWVLYAATERPGVGFFAFFIQQFLLLVVCRYFYVKYQTRMSFPYTREHVERFLRGFKNGSSGASEVEK